MNAVLITGISGGIGYATARRFKEAGWVVCGVDRHVPAENSCIDHMLLGDVADSAFWSDQVTPLLDTVAPLGALVNNAALLHFEHISKMGESEWNESIGTNLTGAFLGARCGIPHFPESGGSIVNVCSVHAVATSVGASAYAASKGGLLSLTRALAVDLAEDHVRVNAVVPGAIATPMLDQGLSRGQVAADPSAIQVQKENLASKTPLGSIGQPSDVAEAIYFLCDAQSASFITGQTLVVDGGALARLSTE